MKAVCTVCMHHCRLETGQRGFCRARKNDNGTILCENYGQITSLALDPIEKKPLRMFHPGAMILSVGSYGCNLRCPFCQNHEISMVGAEEAGAVYLSPEELTERAAACRSAGNIGVAYTYNEPLIGWEYVRDTARLVRQAGMVNVLVTNGSVSLEVLENILPFMDAMNIDLKGFREDYYKMLGGDLETVKDFIIHAAAKCHVELTTLIVPRENDDIASMEKEAQWIAAIDENMPLHLTRFYPRYHMMDRAATDRYRIESLAETAGKYLKNVFI